MDKQKQEPKTKKGFIRKNWLGFLFIGLIFFFFSIIDTMYSPGNESLEYGVTYGLYSPDSQLEILNPQGRFAFFIAPNNVRFGVDMHESDPYSKIPYNYEVKQDRLVIHSIKVNLTSDELANVYDNSGSDNYFVSVKELSSGNYKYHVHHDVPGRYYTSDYIVKNNKILKHYSVKKPIMLEFLAAFF